MKYCKATELTFDPRPQVGKIAVEAFYDLLRHFPVDMAQAEKVFARSIELDYFYAAVEDEEIVALVACKANKPPPIKFDKDILVEAFGLINGSIAYKMLEKYILNHKYPFELSPRTCSIEIAATAQKRRGQGIAGGLITQVMEELSFDEYVLEVVDTNAAAIRMYEKLGFSEFMRGPAPPNSGFNHFIYMKKERPYV